MKRWLVCVLTLSAMIAAGCEAPPLPQIAGGGESAPSPPAPAPPAEPAAEPEQPPSADDVNAAKGDEIRAARAALAKRRAGNAQVDGTPPADGDVLTEAQAGVGVKGKDYGGPGFVTTPIETLFTVEQRIAFEIQIPNAMKIYKAANDNKGPATHEEFMEIIIEENGVALPELPPGQVYWYDAQSEQLMVRAPQEAP